MIYKKSSDYFNFIQNRNDILIEKYKLNRCDFDYEFVYSSEDLKWFADFLSKTLFPKDKYEFIKDYVTKDGNHFIVKFKFCDQEFKIYTDAKDDFIGGNYTLVLHKMSEISNHGYIFFCARDGLHISGTKDQLEKARQEGLAIIHGDDYKFWIKNRTIDGSRWNAPHSIKIKLLNQKFEPEKLHDYLIKGIKELSLKENRLPNYTINRFGLIKNSHQYTLCVDGISVSKENYLLNSNEFKFDDKIGGKIMAYGFLKSLNNEFVELELELENSFDKEDLAEMTKDEVLEWIEDHLK